MSDQRAKNIRVVLLALGLLAGMTTLVVYAPTLYQMFCDLTGFGGTVRRAAAPEPSAASSGVKVTVRFDANVSSDLPWDFRPLQTKVQTELGKPTRVDYYARNNSDETIVARATFNVTPYKAAPYFFKIECFCFTEERLGPGESAKLPLVLYIDEQILKDRNTEEVREVTLSYTFFKQTGLSDKEVNAARDLKAGSQEIDARLNEADKVAFSNDAPRR